MAQDKRLGLTVDTSAVNQLRQSANELAREMIQSSRAYSTSSKEVLRDLDEQIARIEKRNRLEQEGQKIALQSRLQSGAISQSDYRTQMGQLGISSRQDNMQIALLREVIETIKATAKDEIRENRQAVEERVRRDKRVTQLSPSGDAEENLRRTIQRDMIGTVGEAETEERNRFRDFGGSAGAGVNRTLATAAGAKNELSLVAAGAGLVLGVGASALLQRLYSSADTAQRAMGSVAGVRGTSIQKEAGAFGQFSSKSYELGMSPAEFYQSYSPLLRASGGRLSEKGFLELTEAQRARGLDTSTVSSLTSIGRFGQNDMTRVISTFEHYLRKSDRNITLLPEIIGTFTTTATNILSMSGRVDETGLAKAISGIGASTGTEGRQLERVVGGIQGLGKSQNPIVKSMMMRAFRESNPTASFFDIQAMMENPLENIEATQGMLNNLQKLTGGGDLYKQALFSSFGGSLSRTDINQILEGGSFADIADKAGASKTGKIDYSVSASGATGSIQKMSARTEALAQDYGLKAADFTERALSEIQKLFSGGVFNDFNEGVDKLNELPKEMRDKVMEGMREGINQSALFAPGTGFIHSLVVEIVSKLRR